MLVRLGRKLLLTAALWVLGPTLVVYAHSLILPDRVDVYEEETAPADLAGATSGPYIYNAPDRIGTPHQIEIGPALGFGTPEPRLWHGIGATSGPLRPVVVLLHGSGRSGPSMLDMWQDVARSENLILVAPDARGPHWSLVADGPMFLGAVLRDVARHYPMDADRIYLVGHSNGGAHAMRIANLGGGPFKAVLTHSGHPNRFRIIPALTPVPVHSFVGDADQVFTVDSSRSALRRLAKAGHPTSLTVIPNHNHWYYRIGRDLAPLMWQRLTGGAETPADLMTAADAPTPEAPTVSSPARTDTDARTSGAKWIRVTPSN